MTAITIDRPSAYTMDDFDLDAVLTCDLETAPRGNGNWVSCDNPAEFRAKVHCMSGTGCFVVDKLLCEKCRAWLVWVSNTEEYCSFCRRPFGPWRRHIWNVRKL